MGQVQPHKATNAEAVGAEVDEVLPDVEGPHMLSVKGLALKVLHHITPLAPFLSRQRVTCKREQLSSIARNLKQEVCKKTVYAVHATLGSHPMSAEHADALTCSLHGGWSMEDV